MTIHPETPEGKEQVKKSGLKHEQIRDLDVKDQAAVVKGGARIKKGGDPEEGGE